MTEKDRLEIIDKVNNYDSELLDEEKIVLQEIDKLLSSEEVRKYIELENKLNYYRMLISKSNKSNNIMKIFSDYLKNEEHKKECSHNLWIYLGSYKDNDILCSELDKNISYNKYICIECGQVVNVIDYNDFENKNQVIKYLERDIYHLYTNAQILQNEYYSNLYNMNSEKSIKYIEDNYLNLILRK